MNQPTEQQQLMRLIASNLSRLIKERGLSPDYLEALHLAADEDDVLRFLNGVDRLLSASREARLSRPAA